ncbi:esterase/lipase family protein [Tepidimicrobium xylanilyticum]|uniref:Lecithin:cholesterol acyltransferase n=1 Tax=Tepidimicrobium xylanilyticum TaxID=1123352 RepID=A0A1H3C1J1_9FIRM|nr:alpha/beta fold hydrolase [Tepidimicrobium xylanilyticum]SDX47966.1 Lecithin:cholesterol acyltransferase [Tepidimicrobium xylanilyticum]
MDYPVIFVPGLFGSLGDDVINGTGDFSFGPAETVYRPFIKILNSMGYIEGFNLFISYYDWKMPVLESVDKYLSKDIERIKRDTKKEKVIIIGHSLGGLLGRTYLAYFSPSSVDKLIMIGTPNLGVVNAYFFWSGGKIPYSKVEDNIVYHGLKMGFILYFSLFKNINYIEVLRKTFPIARDLLPSYKYGNYLFYEKDGIRKEVPIEKIEARNIFLNKLEEKYIHPSKVFIIAGKDIFTNKEFLVDVDSKDKIKWKDGRPIKVYRTNYGDGTVTTFSALGHLTGRHIVIKGNHIDILYKSKDFLSSILEKPLIRDIRIEAMGIEKTNRE